MLTVPWFRTLTVRGGLDFHPQEPLPHICLLRCCRYRNRGWVEDIDAADAARAHGRRVGIGVYDVVVDATDTDRVA